MSSLLHELRDAGVESAKHIANKTRQFQADQFRHEQT